MNHLQFRVAAGTIAVTWNSRGLLTRIDWYDNGRAEGGQVSECRVALAPPDTVPAHIRDFIRQVNAYFSSGVPLGEVPWHHIDRTGWSEFQAQVYEAIGEIPHGETRTYAWVARRIGNPSRPFASPRAVGQALRRNPLPILIPCHRVVSANALGGFMGISDPDQPELIFKRWLIEAENTYLNPMFAFLGPASLTLSTPA